MFHPLSLYIGLRYTRAKRKNNFISFISLVSIGGIALGITTMIVVLSVMNGFQNEVRERSLAMTAHIAIKGFNGEIKDWQAVAQEVKINPEVEGAAPFTYGQGLLTHEGVVKPVQIQGIHPEFEKNVSDIEKKLTPRPLVYHANQSQNDSADSPESNQANKQESASDKAQNTANEVIENEIENTQAISNPQGFGKGNLQDLKTGEFNIILGIDLARQLNAKLGDKISMISSEVNVSAVGVTPRTKRFTVVGVFDLGIYEYDASIALINIDDAGKMFKLSDHTVQGVRLKVKDVGKTYPTALEITKLLNAKTLQNIENNETIEQYDVYDWTQQFAALFRMIQIEKISMFVIMSLIVAVAVFNVVSTLVMVVTDKRSDIAILRTMGLSPKHIMIIFMTQGIVIGFFGATIGIILGLLIANNVSQIVQFIEQLFNATLFEPSVYPVSDIPALVLTSDVVFVAGFAFLLSSLATLYPAWKAARTQPAEALRYE